MARPTKLFISSSVLALVGAMILHLLLLSGNDGVWSGFIHLTLFGWISGFIFAVNYHTMPVFTARTFPYPALILAHWALFSLGIVASTLGLLQHTAGPYRAGLALEFSSSLVFMANVILLLVRGQKRGQPHPALPEQQKVDRLSTYATKLAGLSLPLALGMLSAVELRWISPGWYLAAEHVATLGWVMLMIVGVACHVLPRWAGLQFRRIWRLRLAMICHSLALLLMIPALGLNWRPLFALGGSLMALGLGLFAWVIWPTIARPAPAQPLIVPTIGSKRYE
jgi:hypothetical protein